MTSIRHRLLLSLLAGLIVCTVIMAGIAYFTTTRELHELFTDNLRRMAIVIHGQAFPDTHYKNDTPEIELEESYIIQTWDQNGTLTHTSTPEVTLPLQPNEGLSTIRIDGRKWQVYTLKTEHTGFTQIAQPKEIVSTMVGESASHALIPLVVLFIMLALVTWLAVGRSLSPLEALSRTIAGWDADKMQPMPITNAPKEIQPIIGALNSLLLKLDKALSLQRQFTADAAHELRTPLTAIKLQLDNLMRAQSEEDRQAAIKKLSEGIDRSIHLAGQLLVASRSMSVKTAHDFQPVRLNELVRSSMATFVVLASSKNIDIAFESYAECRIYGDEEGLRVLINNLLDNAIRYTPQEGTVVVRVLREMNKAILEVSDNGVGISKDEREKIFQRFYRIPGTISMGSGLGLSIVKTVAENHDATLIVMNGLFQQGTAFRISFDLLRSNDEKTTS